MGDPCPCCGAANAFDELPVDKLLEIRLPKRQADVLDKLVTDYPRGTTTPSLLDFVYAFDNVEGDQRAIRNCIYRLRKRLPRYGWTITRMKPGRSDGALYSTVQQYHLKRLEA